MKIIDSHVHFWDFKNKINQWLSQTDFVRYSAPYSEKVSYIHIEAHDEKVNTEKEIDYIKDLYKNYSIKYIAFVDFNNPYKIFFEKIKKLSEIDGLIGVRQIFANSNSIYSPYHSFELPIDLKEKIKILKTFNLIFETQLYPDQYLNNRDLFIETEAQIVLQHMLLPIVNKNDDIWKTAIIDIAKNHNIYLKISGFSMLNVDCSLEDLKYYLSFIINEIDNKNLLYGSNFPISHMFNRSLEWIDAIKLCIPKLYHQDLFYKNARILYSM